MTGTVGVTGASVSEFALRLNAVRGTAVYAALLEEPPPQILEDLRERNLHEHAFCILGGEKNQPRDRGIPHFRRSDEAWFDFSITVRERNGQLELLAYNFEIRFPPGMGVPFLRLDLNLPGHHNDVRDLRCHLHPGSEHMRPCSSSAASLSAYARLSRCSTLIIGSLTLSSSSDVVAW